VKAALVGLVMALVLWTGLGRAQPAPSASVGSGAASAEPPVNAPPLTREESAFLADLSALTRGPHRLSGSPEARAAALHIEQRLRQIGIADLSFLDMPVWRQRTLRCELTLDGVSVPLSPLRPNVTVLPVTPAEGITGPLVYVGRGGSVDYRDREVKGSIVVLEYASFDNWQRAFALGARAVVFVGRGDETPLEPKHAGVPSNQPRFYARAEDLGGVDLTRDRARATLTSQVLWEPAIGRNIVARIRGTDPGFAPDRSEPEALVVAVNYDSFGEAPEATAGARGAANVAALIETAARIRAAPPRRDVVLMFLDNQAHYHQGAREVYDALGMSVDQLREQSGQHQEEIDYLGAMRQLLDRQGLGFDRASAPASIALGLKRALGQAANFARDDARKQVSVARLAAAARREMAAEERRRAEELEQTALRWDELRRALHKDALARFAREEEASCREPGARGERARAYVALFTELRKSTLERFDRRLSELHGLRAMDEERQALRAALSLPEGGSTRPLYIVLHVAFDFSDTGSTWGAVAGDWTNRFFSWRQPKPEGDTPGYYGRVLSALGDSAKTVPGLDALDRRTLADPALGMTFATGSFVSSGTIAGSYGIYNLSLMTGYDRRPRDGHPADSVQALDWRKLRRQAMQAVDLLRALGSSPALTLPPVFKSLAKSKYPTFDQGQYGGDYVGLQVSGSLKEDRPAAGAVLAIWPGNTAWKTQAWSSLGDALAPAYFDPLALETVQESGRFRVIGLREDMHSEVMTLGTLSNSQGQVIAVTTQEKQAQKLTESMRVNLFFGAGYAYSTLSTSAPQPQLLKVLNASSDSAFRANRALWGALRDSTFAYISDQTVDYRIKLFEPLGVAALGQFGAEHPYGTGLDPGEFASGVGLGQRTAEDLWSLNEGRLAELRTRGVTSADLELLHSRANRALGQARRVRSVAEKQANLLRSASLSQHVYLPLRTTMDDLVHAIVLLLLLAIPFAFAMERLVLCATTVYGRIAGFCGFFLGTFGLLYWLHPGFAVAATPTIIFLAFAILLLSSLVIYIVLRKFRTELKAMQGQSLGVHGLEVSRMGTLLAAVSMGMSTMRRRPTRTTLTAITVVMLTFTILAFASFSRTVGVRAAYEGPPGERTRERILVRKLDYSAIERGVLDMLRGQEGEGGLVAPQYWLVRTTQTSERFSVAHPVTGESLVLDAVMGVSRDELGRWPELEQALGPGSLADKSEALAENAVYLPAIVQKVFKLKRGDWVLLNGHRARFAGALEAASLERLKHLDGQSILPVDFQNPALLAATSGTGGAQKDETQLILADEVDRDFVHLSSDQVAIASGDLVRELGGKLHGITVYPGEGVDPAQRGRRIAELVVMPVWAAGHDGVERLIFTVLTEVSGGLALFVPLLLGGLIIFGTLLGSISDREREIYTFSALGLAPGHVGALFFAEAAVYAVVGGMGGQLLAELVAQVASVLARTGHIHPTSINYSSTNSLFAIGVVMATVLVSAIYPAYRASKSANPGLVRSWKLPPPEGDRLDLIFPFTVSAYDITGVMSFLAEHFRHHDDAGLGDFAATSVEIRKSAEQNLELGSDLALAPFDLGVTQHMDLCALPSEIQGVDEVSIRITRASGAASDWYRANRVFIQNLRRQFLLWRTLSSEMIEHYRMQTLAALALASPTPEEAD
jgi:hypothetical protein